MALRREVSAGGAVYRQVEGREPQFLLILDSWNRWTLPKGLIEPGEESLQAAVREVREETGVDVEPRGFLDLINYFYRDGQGELVYKTVHYYLFAVKDGQVVPQLEEISDARWFPAREAVERCDYPDTRPVLEKALARVTG